VPKRLLVIIFEEIKLS